MLRARIIPCLLIRGGALVKTVQFGEGKYVGDPINAVRIFNEKQVDELIVADIDATREGRGPDYKLIGHLAMECRMPLCYAGGVSRLEEVERIIGLGVEKVGICTAAVRTPNIITDCAKRVGDQSVVVVLDVRKGVGGAYEVFTDNAMRATGLEPSDWARTAQSLGAGEVLVNAVHRDGTMGGYDLDLIDSVRGAVTVPVTVLGGAGSLDDIRAVIRKYRVVGTAAGSLFVFKGKYRAVLINYPDQGDKDELLA